MLCIDIEEDEPEKVKERCENRFCSALLSKLHTFASFFCIKTKTATSQNAIPSTARDKDKIGPERDPHLDEPEWKEEWEYFSHYFSELKQFVRDTADRDLALLFYMA